MNGTKQKRTQTTPTTTRPVDELEAASNRADRRRKIFSLIVLAPLVAGMLATSVYTFAPLVNSGDQNPAIPDTQTQSKPDTTGQLAVLEQAVQANPKDYQALVALANLYFDSDRYPEAEATYRRALGINGTDTNVRVDYGTMIFYQNRPIEAINEYLTALKADPSHVNAKVNLGLAYRALKQEDKAKSTWTEALQIAPDAATKQRIEELLAGLGKRS